jgi:hypothetical protein
VGRFASLRFRPKNMAHHIFQSESELQNILEAAPSSPSFSLSETFAHRGSSVLRRRRSACLEKKLRAAFLINKTQIILADSTPMAYL